MEDVRIGRIHVEPMLPPHYLMAGTLLQRYAYSRRLRTLDALQLAVALHLKAQSKLDTIVTSDKLMAEVALMDGLPIFMPAA